MKAEAMKSNTKLRLAVPRNQKAQQHIVPHKSVVTQLCTDSKQQVWCCLLVLTALEMFEVMAVGQNLNSHP